MNDVSTPGNESRYQQMGTRPALMVQDEPYGRAVPILMQYFRIAMRWRWLIAGAVAIALLLGVVLTLLATPRYTASTRIEINREDTRIVNVEGVEPKSSAADQEFYQTQYGLLRSRSLATRVARDLRLADNADFFRTFGKEEVFERLGQGAPNQAGVRDARLRAAATILLDNLSIAPIRLSRLVDISFTSPDPALSALIANAWGTKFIESNLDRRFEATAYARRFLETRLAQLRSRLEESERQVVGYASTQSIINIPIGSSDAGGHPQERSLTADSLAAMNAALAEATAARVQAQSRAGQTANGAVPEALLNPAIAALRQRRADAASEYSRLLTQFEPGYPPAQALQAQIQQLDRSIAREESRVQSSMQNAYRDSVQREQALNERVEGLKQSFLDQRRRSIQYNIFQRDADTNRELYNGLLQRYKEIGIAGGVGTNNVSVVDRADVPERPSQPRPLMNLLLALLSGLAIGIGLALVREQIDETVTDPTDLEKRVGLPLLGAIPKTDGENPLAELKDPKSSLIEAYLSVQASLAFSTDHGIPRTLTVTSTRPAEGKSTTAYAIAYSIARNGAKTILVDGDMRSPSVHQDLGIGNEKGLSTYLSGTDNLEGLIQYPEGEPFAALSAGPQPPNAAELLRGERLNALLQELLAKFDHVVIDSPPVMGLADAPIIASRTEGTVFVVEARGVRARMARLALGRLRQGRAVLLGTVLTKFESKRAHFGYGYDYGYGYGYGDKDKAEA
jgi:succinoglycan biosynthesis transport protein ExoP